MRQLASRLGPVGLGLAVACLTFLLVVAADSWGERTLLVLLVMLNLVAIGSAIRGMHRLHFVHGYLEAHQEMYRVLVEARLDGASDLEGRLLRVIHARLAADDRFTGIEVVRFRAGPPRTD